jgi:hypothetical protein
VGVVFMSYRNTEHGHDRIADELLDRASETLDLGPERSVVGG